MVTHPPVTQDELVSVCGSNFHYLHSSGGFASCSGVPAAYPSNKVQAYSYNQTSIMYIVTEVERP